MDKRRTIEVHIPRLSVLTATQIKLRVNRLRHEAKCSNYGIGAQIRETACATQERRECSRVSCGDRPGRRDVRQEGLVHKPDQRNHRPASPPRPKALRPKNAGGLGATCRPAPRTRASCAE